ncbi:MAG: hypothetical protein R2711_18005 [Acidimicrobiales bacterium]
MVVEAEGVRVELGGTSGDADEVAVDLDRAHHGRVRRGEGELEGEPGEGGTARPPAGSGLGVGGGQVGRSIVVGPVPVLDGVDPAGSQPREQQVERRERLVVAVRGVVEDQVERFGAHRRERGEQGVAIALVHAVDRMHPIAEAAGLDQPVERPDPLGGEVHGHQLVGPGVEGEEGGAAALGDAQLDDPLGTEAVDQPQRRLEQRPGLPDDEALVGGEVAAEDGDEELGAVDAQARAVPGELPIPHGERR